MVKIITSKFLYEYESYLRICKDSDKDFVASANESSLIIREQWNKKMERRIERTLSQRISNKRNRSVLRGRDSLGRARGVVVVHVYERVLARLQ